MNKENPSFKKINKYNKSEQIINQVIDMIKNGTLVYGDKLPPERKLAPMLGVSRLPLREALTALRHLGVITNTASGSYTIADVGQAELFDQLNIPTEEKEFLRDLKEFRLVIESKAAEYACKRRTDADLEKMEASIMDMEKNINSPEAKIEELINNSIDFHNTVIHASKNCLFFTVYAYINQLIRKGREESSKIPERYHRSITEHKAIFEAIKARDIDKAIAEMKKHVQGIY